MIIDFLAGISKKLPEVKAPASPPEIKERLMWTGIALLLFFVMYNIVVFGAENPAEFDFLQMVTASRIGTLLTTGIGPIVLASIFLQLFVGAKIINLNMQDPKDKQKFHEVQKVLAIVIAFVEAFVFVFIAKAVIVSDAWGTTLPILAVIQITLGSVCLLYLDEVISKYGLGSGISIFIAAGVSFSVLGGLTGLIFEDGGVISELTQGGAEGIPNAIMVLFPFYATIAVFIAVVYAESINVEIPIAYERMRGLMPKLPLRLLYVSNIPVIFASAMLMSVVRMSPMLDGVTLFIGDFNIVSVLQEFIYLISPVWSQGVTLDWWLFNTTPILHFPEYIHAIVYVLFLALVSIVFGIFWAETSNMDSKSVAAQLNESGMQVPGYRRDPRMLEKVLEKHIFPLTVLGSFLVGLLAGIADLTGALGTGTGILLTVGILYRMYEQLKQMKALDLYPSIAKMIS